MARKKYALGGEVDAMQQPSYFSGTDQQQGVVNPAQGVNQTFNIQPSASAQPGSNTQATANNQPTLSAQGISGMPTFRKGGLVGSASKRGDGVAQRGKTRGKMV